MSADAERMLLLVEDDQMLRSTLEEALLLEEAIVPGQMIGVGNVEDAQEALTQLRQRRAGEQMIITVLSDLVGLPSAAAGADNTVEAPITKASGALRVMRYVGECGLQLAGVNFIMTGHSQPAEQLGLTSDTVQAYGITIIRKPFFDIVELSEQVKQSLQSDPIN